MKHALVTLEGEEFVAYEMPLLRNNSYGWKTTMVSGSRDYLECINRRIYDRKEKQNAISKQ